MRGDGLTDRQQSRMRIRAITKVLKNVPTAREHRLPHPVDALPAHLGHARGFAVHPSRHVVTAYAGQRTRAFGHPCRAVVRATGTEVRHAPHFVAHIRQDGWRGEIGHQVAPVKRGFGRGQPLGKCRHDARGPQLAQGIDHRPTLAIELADDSRSNLARPVEQQVLDLGFEYRGLFLDHQNLLEALGERRKARGLDRVSESDLVESNAGGFELGERQTQAAQNFHEIEMTLAAGDDAQVRLRRGQEQAIDAVLFGESAHRIEFGRKSRFESLAGQIRHANVQTAFRRDKTLGITPIAPQGVQVHGGTAFHRFRNRFETHPSTRKPRQRPAIKSKLQEFGHAGRIEHWHAPGLKNTLALMGHGGRNATVVVARHHQNTALGRGAKGIAVMNGIGRAIHTRPLAVPQREHAFDGAARIDSGALRAHYRRGGQLLVDGGQKTHIVGIEQVLSAPKRLVYPAQGGTAIAADETRGIPAPSTVEAALLQQ